jgi:carboxymethylenebutenolidase
MTDKHDGPRTGADLASRPRASLTSKDFDPEVWKLFDRYVHGQLSRRGFLDGAAKFAAIVGVTASGLLDLLSPNFAEAQQVPPTDARLDAKFIEIPSPAGYGKVRAYQVRPAKVDEKLPGVLVVHENRGLNPHIEDVARRFALEGYHALAPDALFPLGGYPGNEDDARALFAKLDQAKTRPDFEAAARHLLSSPETTGKVGVVGFCYGGGISNYLAATVPELAAAAPFYGAAAPLDKVPSIKAKLLIHFAETDPNINAAWPAYEAALKKAGVSYEAFTYPGTQHGFHNDTTPRYDAAAAKLAWTRTLALYASTLQSTLQAREGCGH